MNWITGCCMKCGGRGGLQSGCGQYIHSHPRHWNADAHMLLLKCTATNLPSTCHQTAWRFVSQLVTHKLPHFACFRPVRSISRGSDRWGTLFRYNLLRQQPSHLSAAMKPQFCIHAIEQPQQCAADLPEAVQFSCNCGNLVSYP